MAERFIDRIREAVKELGEFTINDLTVELHVCTYKEKDRIRRAVKCLKKYKEVVSIGPGFYRYQGQGKQKPLKKIVKMWRGMRIKEYFTRQDIVRLSGASKIHVKKYFIFLKREGFISPVSGRGYKEGLFRLSDPDNAPLEHPIPKKREV